MFLMFNLLLNILLKIAPPGKIDVGGKSDRIKKVGTKVDFSSWRNSAYIARIWIELRESAMTNSSHLCNRLGVEYTQCERRFQ